MSDVSTTESDVSRPTSMRTNRNRISTTESHFSRPTSMRTNSHRIMISPV